MPKPFITFATSRFINRELVLRELRQVARSLKAACPEVVAIYLFGSFAQGVPTPRSDADILVVVTPSALPLVEQLKESFVEAFLAVSVPVELFVLANDRVEESVKSGRGLAATALREGLILE
jgi:predicted nucleotidyltransferase